MKNGQFLCDFWWFFGPLESRWDPYPSPDALRMIILSLGHSILYVTMRNLIQCMGDMALMPKICENSQFWVVFDDFRDLWSSDMTPYPTPDALWLIISSLGNSIINVPMVNLIQCMDNMTAMAKIYLKNRSFLGDFLDFWGLWSPDINPHTTPVTPWMTDLALGHSTMYVTMSNLIQYMGYMALMQKIREK